MSLAEAVRSVLGQYATFAGRARRAEYWWYTLFLVGAYVIAGLLGQLLRAPDLLIVLVMLATLLPSLAVTVRRLHDTGRSGWWYLVTLIPFVGGFVLLGFTLLDSQSQPNAFGPSPKHPAVNY